MEKGYVQVFYGDGRGKTSLAFGTAMRAVGRNLKVIIIQFMKKGKYGEIISAEKLGIKVEQYGFDRLIDLYHPDPELKKMIEKGIKRAEDIIKNTDYDLLILDEIFVAMGSKLISISDIKNIINLKKKHAVGMELILTGRGDENGNIPEDIISMADLVSKISMKKHYYNTGVIARKGIEF